MMPPLRRNLGAARRLALIGLLLLGGCSALQPSYYENRSRDGENRVVAQGQAASNAAWVHASSASLGQTGGGSPSSRAARTSSAETDPLRASGQRLYGDTLRSTTSALSSVINRSITEALR